MRFGYSSNLIATTTLLLSSLGLLAGCGDDTGATADKGDAQVFVEPEETIPGGLAAGTGEEDVQDGWAVTYDRFLVSIGNFRAARSDATETLAEPETYVLDLLHAPAGGYVIKTFEDVSAVRWDRFGFDLPNATASAKTLAPTTAEDAKLLADGGWSVYFEGKIEKEGVVKTFKWGLPAGTSFDDCANEDGTPGFAVPSGGSAQVKPTIHGDHWFFNNVTAGAEVTKRYAQYIADADADADGETTIDELKALKAADAFPAAQYNLAGGLTPIETAYDYVLAQARTLGDFQGDGECPTRKILP
ncbi:hypothetical protein [Polyangium aurulentum]|uniref:hypothetical protein n=1 Tax=Polyangium aurulentum TaxID=2567896 RepID=UPI0010AEAE4B|nr:hypothetical protein [Polyangium aurulentum]UQA59665.1 hypothetical protein E8A73_003930 [Polyangium aurulentum]